MKRNYMIVLVIGALAGCATAPGIDKPAEKKVAENAQAYWNAVVADDYKTTYGMMTPGYRERMTYEQHIVRNQPFAKFLSAKILQVACSQPDSCAVDVSVNYKDMNLGRRVIKGEQSSTFQDRWILDGGRWWRYPPR